MSPSRATIVCLVVCLLAPRSHADGSCSSPWENLGQELAGTNGLPGLVGSGPLAADTQVSLGLFNALGGSLASLVVGASGLDAAFKGGVMVPNPDVIVPQLTSAMGTVEISATWPAGIPVGTAAYFQWWVSDPGGPAGFAASNGLRATTPDVPFPASWVNGTDCANEPDVQSLVYDADTVILRQSQCTNFEGPFMYLLFGSDTALLLDTGAGNINIRNVVDREIANWLLDNGKTSIDLIVAHTHGHGDHWQGDSQFVGRPDTTIVGISTQAVIDFYGFQQWPHDLRQLDLGGRVIDVLGIPGHQAAHIALYDRNSNLLLTGDTLYPGFLFIFGAVSQGNFAIYKDSIARLVAFTSDKPVTWVMGNHIEMTSTPGVAYPYGTSVQPFEHTIQLGREHLLELDAAIQAMGSNPVQEVHDDFIIDPSF